MSSQMPSLNATSPNLASQQMVHYPKINLINLDPHMLELVTTFFVGIVTISNKYVFLLN
jgi:predicted membrane-bound spermidine synthase